VGLSYEASFFLNKWLQHHTNMLFAGCFLYGNFLVKKQCWSWKPYFLPYFESPQWIILWNLLTLYRMVTSESAFTVGKNAENYMAVIM
jgi:hypothetical protein